ncbi:uncharacterized protein LOC110430425 [Sorghum bicolor]|uniref:uncharacterized protein LOC110430425 n=1 Tax=Sorghum bicolor TaxID=4558 RepID=UPI000B42549B|nr:uncharacterized protein LOC110430425 [Sorghum bicolor]|eukprot:XP_021303776.1 uncharacterized protein LOC110430425 [Sorghum bicolor]
MATSLRDYSTPTVANVPIGSAVNTGNGNFELRTGLLTMVQDVAPESVKLRLFPFSLSGKVKQWFYQSKEAVNTWDKCSTAFLVKFFPMSKTNALRGKISNFQQTSLESIREAWERLQEYIRACPHHGMEDWLMLQNFYEGLTPMSKGHVDAATGGAFLSLTIENATTLIEKMRLDGHATDPTTGTIQAIDSRMTCKECGNVGHMGINCPSTQEDASFINNGFRQQQQGQAKINENLVKKLSENDQMFVNINTKRDGLTLSVRDQLAFNKKIESKVAQLASVAKAVVSPHSVENVNAVTTRGGKTTHDPPYPNHKIGRAPRQQEGTQVEGLAQPSEESIEDEPTPNNYGDTTMLPFPTRERRKKKDENEQLIRFVEMVEKTHVSVLLMDVLHIPSYSKFIKDIINKERPLPSTEVVKLIEECSAAILNELPKKKQDLGIVYERFQLAGKRPQ